MEKVLNQSICKPAGEVPSIGPVLGELVAGKAGEFWRVVDVLAAAVNVEWLQAICTRFVFKQAGLMQMFFRQLLIKHALIKCVYDTRVSVTYVSFTNVFHTNVFHTHVFHTHSVQFS